MIYFIDFEMIKLYNRLYVENNYKTSKEVGIL